MTFDARPLQTALAAQTPLYDPGPIDGVFGKTTQAAMNHWQRDHALPETFAPVAEVFIGLGIPLPPEMPEQPAPPAPKASNPITDLLTGLAIKAALNSLKGLPIVNILNGYKTIILGVVTIIVGGLALLGWDIPGFQHVPGGIIMDGGLAMIFLRLGIKNAFTDLAEKFISGLGK